MSTVRLFLALLTLATLAVSGVADAHPRGGRYYGRYHGHPRFGFYFGAPLYTRPFYPYPYYPYYPPEIVTIPVEPPVYIEREAPRSDQSLSPGYWYYCTDPEGYYPYVKECPSGWLQVNPVPPSTR